ncbi:hypothetical protein LMG31884_45260 [Xanthomonas hydrangeae]|nr:hypothetical protein LMG31884_45260 [Xanthomonas hydrangeae]CAD7730743.1 hypothetical protein LMG31884_45260 [Xanthomonas hydrangeae]CAD7745809.1 hypothetical protein LMG31887_45180 [Xanthomonas hydrangeae]CAD7745812.1 hypothetical protein LMG31887_45180 [Xanthomonas hydrangeae]
MWPCADCSQFLAERTPPSRGLVTVSDLTVQDSRPQPDATQTPAGIASHSMKLGQPK